MTCPPNLDVRATPDHHVEYHERSPARIQGTPEEYRCTHFQSPSRQATQRALRSVAVAHGTAHCLTHQVFVTSGGILERGSVIWRGGLIWQLQQQSWIRSVRKQHRCEWLYTKLRHFSIWRQRRRRKHISPLPSQHTVRECRYSIVDPPRRAQFVSVAAIVASCLPVPRVAFGRCVFARHA